MVALLMVALVVFQQIAAERGSGVITVRILERGTDAPLPGVRVWARQQGPNHQGLTAETGSDGIVILSELPAGSYELRAHSDTHLSTVPEASSFRVSSPPPPVPPSTAGVVLHQPGIASVALSKDRPQAVTFRLERGAVVSGHVLSGGVPLAGASVRLHTPQNRRVLNHPLVGSGREVKTDAGGRFLFSGLYPGTFLLSAHPDPESFFRFNPVYYPGVVDVEDASRIVVGPGTHQDVLLAIERVATVTVSGRVIDREESGEREIIIRRLDVDTHAITNALLRLRRDGSFVAQRTQSAVHGLLYTRKGQDGVLQAAATNVIHVAGEPVTGLELRAVRSASLSGRFVFENPPAGLDPNAGIHLHPEGEDRWMREMLTSGGAMNDDGTFQISGIIGNHRIDVNEPDGWIAEAVLLPDGRKILDTTFQFEPGKQYGDVRVLLSDRVATIRGSTVPGSRAIYGGGVMTVAFPEDQSLWRVRRHLRFGHVNDQGDFSISNIRPGQTYLVATCRWPCDVGYSGEGLQDVSRRATRLYVDRPGVFNVDLRGR